MDRPVLFLDFDGVLNTYKTQGELNLDNDKLQLLESTFDIDYDIVLTTSWRILMKDWVLYNGVHLRDIVGNDIFKRIISKTNNTPYIRGKEIDLWMDEYGVPVKYCILDDDDDMLDYQLPFTVLVDGMLGLTENDINKVRELLS